MMFDDYNYSQYNKFVLNMDPKNLDYEEDDATQGDKPDFEDQVSSYLNKAYLKDNHSEIYDHIQLNILSEEEKERIKNEKMEKRRLQRLADHEAFLVEQ